MHNRGNGKGGGIAAVGLVPEQLGVSREVLDESLHAAHRACWTRRSGPRSRRSSSRRISTWPPPPSSTRWTTGSRCRDLEVQAAGCVPLLRPRQAGGARRVHRRRTASERLDRREAEDEFVNQNSFKLNQKFYASLGEKRAFVLSHGRNIMILKVVGYAEAIVKYYKIEDLCAHVWIAHQRYPDQGPRLASRRRASLCGDEHGPGAQRRLRQLPFRQRVSQAAEHLSAVPDRHRGLGPAVRPAGPDVSLSARIHHRGPGADDRAGLRPARPRRSRRSTGRSRRRTSTARPTARGSSSSPATSPARTSSSSWASRTPRCSGRRCSPSATARSRSA